MSVCKDCDYYDSCSLPEPNKKCKERNRMSEMNNYTVKDSGNSREFASGAVRDMQAGKGRCDLLPLAELSTLITNMDIEKDCMETIISFNDHPDSVIFRHFNCAINALNRVKDPDTDNRTIEMMSCEIVDSLYLALETFLVHFYRYPENGKYTWCLRRL